MKSSAKLLSLVVALISVAAFTGCGGSSGVSASSYVKSICQAVGPFQKDVQARAASLNVGSISSASTGKTVLASFLAAVAGDADHALTQIKAAGSPSVSNGGQISSRLVQAFTQVHNALQGAQTQAGALPTNSPAAFKTAATGIGTTVQSSLSGIGSSLGTLKSPDLEKAAKSEPACKNLGK